VTEGVVALAYTLVFKPGDGNGGGKKVPPFNTSVLRSCFKGGDGGT